MPTLPPYPVLNFSGGVRRDKSSQEMDRTELLDARNIEIFEQGKIRTRRGSYQVGQTLSGNIENSFVWERVVAGSTPVNSIYVNNNASVATVSVLRSTRLTSDITPASTTISAVSTSNFSSSGNLEIEGDLIAYTGGGGGGGPFTGVTGITSNHSAGASIDQWTTLTLATEIDGQLGVYYAVLNNVLVFGGRAGRWNAISNDNGVTTSAISGEPSGIFHTNYRDKIFVVGDGSTDGDPRRVFFSARGDGTSWTPTSDYFDVEDQQGETCTGLKVLSDNLLIFKTNSIFTYNEVELKKRVSGVGAWNHKTPVEIDGTIYTFCPRGIFATNGFSAKQIGEPVRAYWENFQPNVDAVTERVVTNTFGARYKENYILYIQDITTPYNANDVCLIYNTKLNSWTTWNGLTDIQHFFGTEKYRLGDRPLQFRPSLYTGDASGKYYRFFDSRYVDRQSPPVKQGFDVFQDLISNTGVPVSAVAESPLYDFGQPAMFKTPKRLRVYAEQGSWNFEWRVENENQITQYKPLGVVTKTNQTLDFPKEAQGYRVGIRFSAVNTSSQSILNGYVFEGIEVTERANAGNNS